MKSKNEKLYKVLMLLGIAIFFLTAVKCNAQIDRYKRCDGDMEVITKIPKKTMTFSFTADTSFKTTLSVYSDSSKTINYRLYAYFPENIITDKFTIKLGLKNGDFMAIKPFRSDNNYVEYTLSDKDISKLKEAAFDYLEFDSPEVKFMCVGLKAETYFLTYLAQL